MVVPLQFFGAAAVFSAQLQFLRRQFSVLLQFSVACYLSVLLQFLGAAAVFWCCCSFSVLLQFFGAVAVFRCCCCFQDDSFRCGSFRCGNFPFSATFF
jgi:hypothetical protein